MSKDILFVGGLFPKEREKEILNNSIGNIQNAANNLQWEFIEGLDRNNGVPIKIINSLYIGSYPKRYKKINIDTYYFSHTKSTKKLDINVGFINIYGIKHLSKILSLKKHIESWAEIEDGREKVIVSYAMSLQSIKAIKYAKIKNKNIKSCLIIPDLPGYMNMSSKKNKFYQVLKKFQSFVFKNDEKYIDSFVILTKYMKDKLKLDSPSVVIEGISSNIFRDIDISKENEKKTILYTGGLNEKYGVINLIKNFSKLKYEDVELILCGSGEAEKKIKNHALKDKRIKYLGLLPREKVLKLQKSATLLINPRPNNEEFTKYSFPSKILEYLSSGTPVLSYKLDGIPDEYYDHMFIIEENPEGILNKLEEVLSMSEDKLYQKGLDGQRYVLESKNNIVQTKKIIEMINSLN